MARCPPGLPVLSDREDKGRREDASQTVRGLDPLYGVHVHMNLEALGGTARLGGRERTYTGVFL